MQDKNKNINVDLCNIDEIWGTVWSIGDSNTRYIWSKHKNTINQYLDRIVLWVRLALYQGRAGKVLNYKKITTSRYIFDIFSGKNPWFNDRYVWHGKMFSHQEFFSIEKQFNLLWYQALESELENIIKSNIDFRS